MCESVREVVRRKHMEIYANRATPHTAVIDQSTQLAVESEQAGVDDDTRGCVDTHVGMMPVLADSHQPVGRSTRWELLIIYCQTSLFLGQ